ncbi:hypothetical protein BH18ACI4_BH18ACI4_21940 [soil metagenome]
MTKRMRVRITIETDQQLVVRKRNVVRAWCEGCGKNVEFGTLWDICTLTCFDVDIIHRLIATKILHSVKAYGLPLICLQSVLKQTSNPFNR